MAIDKVTAGIIANDAINGTKLADNSTDSEHYTDGSIDTAHIADNAVTGAKIEDNPTIAGNLIVTGNMTVSGTTTTVDTTLTLSDAMVVNNAGSDVGIKVNSTSTGHILQLQDNGADKIVVADGGITTFSAAVTVPTPTTSAHAATKAYVDLTLTPSQTFHFLVVGGGGGGSTGYNANAGAGGAGGFRASWNNEGSGGYAKSEIPGKFISGAKYTITVGAGGGRTQANPGGGEHGFTGENSSIVGPAVNIVSFGGGGGAYQMGGFPGGSAGSAGWNTTDVITVQQMNMKSHKGTAGQGFAGGMTEVYGASAPYSLPGGGGAGGPGGDGTTNGVTGGVGGTGKESTITGAGVYYSGGGGGFGSSNGGAGGNGGGSQGGKNGSFTTTNATVNTGGGGGCGSQTNGYQAGAAGGSGIVVIRLATSDYTGATTTGSPTITTSGTDTIIKFTGSGTYTAK